MSERGGEPSEGSPPLHDVEALVREAQRGDPLAMNALLRELAPFVGRVCGAVALDHGEDAMQETLIAVLRNLGALREPAAIHGWVRRIAVREAVRLAGQQQPVMPAGAPATLPDVDTALDVRATLASLTPEQRAILLLRDLEGLTEAEAAAVLEVAPGTVKSRLHRARAAFQRRWAS